MQQKRCITSMSHVTLQCQGIPFGPKWARCAERHLCAVQSVRTEIQVLHKGRHNGKLSEGGLSLGSGYNRHERFLQRVALRTLSSGSKSGDYARRNSAMDARAHPPLMSGEMLISSTVNPTRSTS